MFVFTGRAAAPRVPPPEDPDLVQLRQREAQLLRELDRLKQLKQQKQTTKQHAPPPQQQQRIKQQPRQKAWPRRRPLRGDDFGGEPSPAPQHDPLLLTAGTDLLVDLSGAGAASPLSSSRPPPLDTALLRDVSLSQPVFAPVFVLPAIKDGVKKPGGPVWRPMPPSPQSDGSWDGGTTTRGFGRGGSADTGTRPGAGAGGDGDGGGTGASRQRRPLSAQQSFADAVLPKTLRELEEEQFRVLLQQRLGLTREELEDLHNPETDSPHNTDLAITAALSVELTVAARSRSVDLAALQHHARSGDGVGGGGGGGGGRGGGGGGGGGGGSGGGGSSAGGGPKQRRAMQGAERPAGSGDKSQAGRPSQRKGRAAAIGSSSPSSMVQAASTAAELRRQLNSSIGTVQSLTHSVRHDIEFIRTCGAPIGSARARHFMRRWSAELMTQICARLWRRLLGAQFSRWAEQTRRLRKLAKRRECDRLVAARRAMLLVAAAHDRRVRRAMDRWRWFSQELRAVEADAVLYARALKVQTRARVFLSRRRRELKRFQREHRAEWGAAVRIQTTFRAMAGARRGRAFMQLVREARASTKVQAMARGRAGRRAAAAAATLRQQDLAVRMMQQALRRFAARQELRRRRIRASQDLAATKINAAVRGLRGRQRAKRRAVQRHRFRAAAKMQVGLFCQLVGCWQRVVG
jgi:hypothetical protein